jgi:hypothetical protein
MRRRPVDRNLHPGRPREHGLVALEIVMTAAVCVPASAMLYILYEAMMNHYGFLVGVSVGMPLF